MVIRRYPIPEPDKAGSSQIRPDLPIFKYIGLEGDDLVLMLDDDPSSELSRAVADSKAGPRVRLTLASPTESFEWYRWGTQPRYMGRTTWGLYVFALDITFPIGV